MRPIFGDVARSVAFVGQTGALCKTAEPIAIRLGMQTRVGRRNSVLDGVHIGATLRIHWIDLSGGYDAAAYSCHYCINFLNHYYVRLYDESTVSIDTCSAGQGSHRGSRQHDAYPKSRKKHFHAVTVNLGQNDKDKVEVIDKSYSSRQWRIPPVFVPSRPRKSS